MESSEKRVWGIHTKNDYLFLHENVIAIGWYEMGDMSLLPPDREAFREKMAAALPEKSKASIATMNGQVYRFVHEIQVGDYVVFPSSSDRMINIGVVEGPYYCLTDLLTGPEQYPNRHKVKWLKHIPRTQFSQGALYEAGAAMSVFLIKNYADEFLSALDGSLKPSASDENDEESIAVSAEQTEETTKDYIIKELSKYCKGYPLEDVVNDLLKAMGYRTKQSKQGGDSGIDIVAFKDELPPRIVVQVKSGDGLITENVLQSFKGAMAPGDYGWFVTLSDYKPNARKFLDANPQISGINGAQLAELIMKYYKQMTDKYTRIFPLKQVYIPVGEE